MSFSSIEDLSESHEKLDLRWKKWVSEQDNERGTEDSIIERAPENLGTLTPGRANLRKWLSKVFRVVISDGRVLVGGFHCTDKDANIVLAMAAEYLDDNEERILGNIMIPGRHIVSISVEVDMSTGGTQNEQNSKFVPHNLFETT